MKPIFNFFVFLAFTSFTLTQAATVTCKTDRIQIKMAANTEAKVFFQFVPAIIDNLPVLNDFRGYIQYPNFLTTKIKDTKPGDMVYNKFSATVVNSNPKYDPHKYFGYIQFKKIEGKADSGSSLEELGLTFMIKKDDFMNPSSFKAIMEVQMDQSAGKLNLTCTRS